MACDTIHDLTDAEYVRRFNRKVTEARIPVSGAMALTYRCNLRCRMCYLHPASSSASSRRELDTAECCALIDACAEAGCLSLLLTGGEPLLRPDFASIYRHAREQGLLVTVFSNGTLVNDELLALWSEFVPLSVEITLYGATAPTYEAITGVPGSYARCRQGIERLLARRVPVRLKTVLMSANVHEFEAIERMAREYGVRFRLDAGVFPGLQGQRQPLEYRVSPEDAVAREFADAERARDWQAQYDKHKPFAGVFSDRLYGCGAGITAFFIDPHGWLAPCVMVRTVGYDLADGCFAEGWRKIVNAMDAKKADAGFACRQCERKILCGYCPGFFELETGSEMRRSEYICAMGGQRWEQLEGRRQGARDESRG